MLDRRPAPTFSKRPASLRSKWAHGVSAAALSLAIAIPSSLQAQESNPIIDLSDPNVSVDLSVLNDGGLSPQMGAPMSATVSTTYTAPSTSYSSGYQRPGEKTPVSTLYIKPDSGFKLPPQTKSISTPATVAKIERAMTPPTLPTAAPPDIEEPLAMEPPVAEAPAAPTPPPAPPAVEAPPSAPADVAEQIESAEQAEQVAALTPPPPPAPEEPAKPEPEAPVAEEEAPEETSEVADILTKQVIEPAQQAPAAAVPPPPAPNEKSESAPAQEPMALDADTTTPPPPPPAASADTKSVEAAEVAMPPMSAPKPASEPASSSTVIPLPPQTSEAAKPTAQPEQDEIASLPPATGSLSDGDQMRIVFDADSSKLPGPARDQLAAMAGQMREQSDLRLQLLAYAGNADTSASAARRLSLSRALAVRSFLIENGVRSTRIDVRALGNKSTEEVTERVDITVVAR